MLWIWSNPKNFMYWRAKRANIFVDKGESAGFQQFFLLPNYYLPNNPDDTRHWERSLLRNIVGKEENAGNQHFLHLPQCFLP